jgi:hypothetical protein
MRNLRTRIAVAACLPLLLASVTACDIVTADLKAQETAEWRKSFPLQQGGRVEISNVNGKIDVEPAAGNTVEVVAIKAARGASPEAAKEALQRIEIIEASTPGSVKIETRLQRGGGGFFHSGGGEVRYTVKVPADAEVHFTTVNGGIELLGLTGRITAETTNGGVRAREVAGSIQATTTNGGVDVELARVAERGVKLECTNGGITLRLPGDAKATISANVTNGGIDTGGLSLDATESTRRKLEARLNGGGPPIRIEGTNGGIHLGRR